MLQFHDPTVLTASALRSNLTGTKPVTRSSAQYKAASLHNHSWTLEESRFALSLLIQDALTNQSESSSTSSSSKSSASSATADVRIVRLSLLREEIDLALRTGTVIGTVADALDGLGAVKDEALKELLLHPALRLGLKERLWLLIALAMSTGESKVVGRRLLITTLKEAFPVDKIADTLKGLEDIELVQHIAHFASEEGTALGGSHFAKVAIDVTLTWKTSFFQDVHGAASPTAAAHAATVPLAHLIEEFGPSCIASQDDARTLLDLYSGPITPQVVADCLVAIASYSLAAPTRPKSGAAATAAHDESPFATWAEAKLIMTLADGVNHGGAAAATAASGASQATESAWQTANLVVVIKEREPSLPWLEVLHHIDQPQLRLEPQNQIGVVIAAYRRATNQVPPLGAFLRPWHNVAAQTQCVKYLMANPATSDRTSLVATQVPDSVASPAEVSPFFRFPEFASLIAVLAHSNRDAATVFAAASRAAPALVFASLLSSANQSSVCMHQAIQIIVQCTVRSTLTPEVIDYLFKCERKVAVLKAIAQYVQSDAARFSPLSVGVFEKDPSLYLELLKVESEPRVDAIAFVFGCASNAVSPAVIHRALSSGHATVTARVALAAAIVEVCDEVVLQGVMAADSPAVAAALAAVLEQAAILVNYPSTIAHARQLLGASGAQPTAAAPQSTASAAKPGLSGGPGPDGRYPADVEESATKFLEAMFLSQGVNALERAQALVNSAATRDHDIFACVVSTILEEAKAVSNYPDKEMRVFATFFGQLICNQLLISTNLQTALRLVLQALRTPVNQRCLDFGVIALSVFKERVVEWPSYGQQLKRVADLDMRVPGIMAIINSPVPASSGAAAGAAMGANSVSPAETPAPSATATTETGAHAGKAATGDGIAAAFHQHDIRIIQSDAGSIAAPPSLVQDRINFLISNTDPSRVEATAQELKSLLKPEFYPFFADYLVVKRVSLEANNHRMYVSLVERMEVPALMQHLRIATISACKKLMDSDRIRTSVSDRTLLKSLGSWLGLITVAVNVPIFARDLDLKSLIPRAVAEGKLIGIVPFVCKIVECSVHSRIFRARNPWIMSLLCQLVEMYQLPELKMTLRFEVEVLFKNLLVNIQDIAEYKERVYPHPKAPLIELKRKHVDMANTLDFRAELQSTVGGPIEAVSVDPGIVARGPEKKILNSDAAPYQPKGTGDPSRHQPQVPNPAAALDPRLPGDVLALIPPKSRAVFRAAVSANLETAFKESMQVVERTVVIAISTTRDIVVKDFHRDPDDGKMRAAASSMARALSANLLAVSLRDVLCGGLKKLFANSVAMHAEPQPAPAILADAVDALARDNLDLLLSVLEGVTAEKAAAYTEANMVGIIEERRKAIRSGDFPITTPEQERKESQAMLPETLRPRGALHASHLSVYHEFISLLPQRPQESVTDSVMGCIQQIEEAATRHYQQCPPTPSQFLSLHDQAFTETNQSEHHQLIKRRLVETSQFVTNDVTAVPVAAALFPRLVSLSDRLSTTPANEAGGKPSTTYHVLKLVFDACLFVLRTARERGQSKVVMEVTKAFVNFDPQRRWSMKELVAQLLKIQLIDHSDLDASLTSAIAEGQLNGTGPSSNRAAVEFAGYIVQHCIIDEKCVLTKDLKSTLKKLEEIAYAPKAKRPITLVRVHSSQPPEGREQIEAFFREWISICSSRKAAPTAPAPATAQADGGVAPGAAPAAPSADGQTPAAAAASSGGHQTQQLVLSFVSRLQQHGMLKIDGALDRFLGIAVEMSVEEFATQATLHLEREGKSQAPVSVAAATNGVLLAPSSRLPHDPKFFSYIDAFSDLVVVLIKCCAWSHPRGADTAATGATTAGATNPAKAASQAEIALVTKITQIVSRVLQHNHDFFANNVASTHPQTLPKLPDGHVLQDSHMQQPFLRFYSNLLIALQPSQADEGVSSSEVFVLIANALHQNSPMRLPGFAFAWIELVSHRVFVARMLKAHQGWPFYFKLLSDALRFMDPFIRHNEMPSSMLMFFKCVLKVFLLLLHDFPEFLLTYHQPLCDLMHINCVQLRNVVLSAFPRGTKLPDPFAQTLRIEALPEVAQHPVTVSSVREAFSNKEQQQFSRDDIDAFLLTRKGGTAFVSSVCAKLRSSSGRTNVVLLNALVLYCGIVTTEKFLPPLGTPWNVAPLAVVDLFTEILATGDSEMRYFFFNACANQLRFPNSHTHFFSSLLLHFFLHSLTPGAPQQTVEQIQETITRVLFERLIVTRPHPWGLLITFIELVKNKKYDFWEKPFIRCAPEIERMFESVGQSVNTPAAAAGPPAALRA